MPSAAVKAHWMAGNWFGVSAVIAQLAALISIFPRLDASTEIKPKLTATQRLQVLFSGIAGLLKDPNS